MAKKDENLTNKSIILEHQKAILDNIPHLVLLKKVEDFSFQYFNAAGLKFMGSTLEEIIGKTDKDFFAPEQFEEFQKQDQEVIETKQELYIEEEVVLNGEKNFLRTRKIPIFGEGGEVEHILILAEDITSYKLQEMEIRRQRDFFEETINRLPAVFYAKDLDCRFIAINESFRQLFDKSDDDFIGKSNFEVFPEEIAEVFQKNDRDIVDKREVLESKEKAIDANGETRHYHSFKFPYIDDNGEVYATGGISLDITENKELSDKAFHSSKMAAVGLMAAGVAHEINNPLAIMVGFCEQIEKIISDQELDPIAHKQITRAFEKVNRAGSRISNIVNGLRNFSRSESEDFHTFDPEEVCIESIELLKEMYEKEGVCMEFVNTSKVGSTNYFYGNRGKIQQVLMNLLSNSKDAVLGRDKMEITVNYKLEEGNLMIAVKDTGVGIPEEIKQKIFDPFYTTKDVNAGTGIGLSIVHNIIKEHDGSLEVKSTLGEGTEFIINLPTSACKLENTPDEDLKDKTTDVVERFGTSKNILIVDDEEDIRELLVAMLKPSGKKYTSCSNGEEALELLKDPKNDFDVVISDVQMPKLDGFNLLKKIRENTTIKQPKVVIMTGGVSVKMQEMSKKMEGLFDAFLKKPFQKKDLEGVFQEIETKA